MKRYRIMPIRPLTDFEKGKNMVPEIKNPVQINHERSGCRINVSTNLPYTEIKSMLNYVADGTSNSFVPSEITQEAGGYTFYIRHRQSVKDYLCSKEATIDDFVMIVRIINDVFKISDQLGVSPYDFIFDYNCIYTGQTLETAEFVYAPGGNNNKEFNSAADMLAITSLHINLEDNSSDEMRIKEVLNILSEWEKSNNTHFPYESIIDVIGIEQKKDKALVGTWQPFFYFQFSALIASIFLFALIPFKENGIFVWIAWILLYVSVDYLLIPGDKNEVKEHIKESIVSKFATKEIKLIGNGFLEGVKYSVDKDNIFIGRNLDWADIKILHFLVSRKHAEIIKKDSNLYIKDLNSKNGTYINGKRIASNEEVEVRKGSIIAFGDVNNIVIRYDR